MTRVCRTLGILAVTLALSAPARAETIVINSGFLEWIRPAGVTTIQLAGDGFTFSGIGRTGIFEPLDTCGVPDCVPGATVDLHAYWIGSDLPGTATYNGTTFTQVGGFNSNTSLGARWTGLSLIHI